MNSAVLTASLTGRIQFFCYGALLRTTTTSCCEPLQPARDASIPPLLYGDPDAAPGPRPDRPRGVNRGYEPSGATCARHFQTSWGMSLLPAVEVRKAARRWRCPTFTQRFRTTGIPLPLRNPLPPSVREPEASRPVSGRGPLQGACQPPPRRGRNSMRSHIPSISMALRMRCHGAFKGCEALGRHAVTPLEVTNRRGGCTSNSGAASRSRVSPPR
jgi:hypothetical protein